MTVDWMQLVRLGVHYAAAWLVFRGIGDAALWEAVGGAILAIAAWFASKRAMGQAKAAVPPEVEARLQEMAAQLRQMQGVKG